MKPVIEASIQGIPCKVRIETYLVVPPWTGPISKCPSDLDYYGYTEIEFTVLDRKGYEANWLFEKMTDLDRESIEHDISVYMGKEEY